MSLKDKIESCINGGIKVVGITGCLYFLSMIGVGTVANILSPQINPAQIEQLVEQERLKINPQNKSEIKVNFYFENKGVSRKKLNYYEIDLGGNFVTETTLRHELYHILAGHCDRRLEKKNELSHFLEYFFWNEPTAILYQTTGWKL